MTQRNAASRNSPYSSAAAVVPADATVLISRALWIGGAGNVVVTMVDGTTATFTGVPAGTLLPIAVSRVMTATTATNIVALN